MPRRICVIDGQAGSIGAILIKCFKRAFVEDVELIALGTNPIATTKMLKAGASKVASGENAICGMVMLSDYLVGPIAVSWANAMLGEVTPKMAEAITSSPALKFFLPLPYENAQIMGVTKEPIPHLVKAVVERINEKMKNL